MTQVFLSYSSNDRERVQPLVEALQEDGFTVWWDREIRPGPSFDREIERAIADASCMVVVWSSDSVESEWVRTEVEEGARQGILVPVLLDDVLPPLAYRRRQSANLTHWNGERDGEYGKLISGIEATLAGDQAVPESAALSGAAHGNRHQPGRRRRRPVSLNLTIVIALASLLLGAGIAWFFAESVPGSGREMPSQVVRFEVRPPPGVTISNSVANSLFITRDGKKIVFNGREGAGSSRLYSKAMADLLFLPIPGIHFRGMRPLGSLWGSRDGQWIIFNDGSEKMYKKLRLTGGKPVSVMQTGLAAGGGIRGLSWAASGDIVYANSANDGLMIMENSAGKTRTLTKPGDGFTHGDPFYLADGSAVLYSVIGADQSSHSIAAYDFATAQEHKLVDGGDPLVTSSGHLLFVREGVVWATAFDAERLEVYGKQMPVLEGISLTDYSTRALDVADNGTLVYVPGVSLDQEEPEAQLVWVGLDGTLEEIPLFLRDIVLPRISPDGRQVVLMDVTLGQVDLWIHTFEEQITSRLTFESGFNVMPDWTPDGKRVIYHIIHEGKDDLALTNADGTGHVERLAENAFPRYPTVAPGGRTVVFSSCDDQCDIARVDITGSSPFEILLETKFNERMPMISPDGRWITYYSDESGQDEIYVRPYPGLDEGRWQVSTNGGVFPVWSRTGSKLYYVESASSSMMVAGIQAKNKFSADRPIVLLDVSSFEVADGRGNRNFAIDEKGERFLMLKNIGDAAGIVVVLNWLDEVERLVPTGR